MSAPQDARTWRGEAAVDADEAAERLTAGRLGGGSRRLLRELLSPYSGALKLLVLARAVVDGKLPSPAETSVFSTFPIRTYYLSQPW